MQILIYINPLLFRKREILQKLQKFPEPVDMSPFIPVFLSGLFLSRLGVSEVLLSRVIVFQVVDVVVLHGRQHLMSLDKQKRHHRHLQQCSNRRNHHPC